MPAPDPESLWVEQYGNGSVSVTFTRYFWTGNAGNREVRANRICRRVQGGTWVCKWCGDPLPNFRRVDALYCCEGCRKRAAHRRRQAREGREATARLYAE